jgi:general secretion pathway protein D
MSGHFFKLLTIAAMILGGSFLTAPGLHAQQAADGEAFGVSFPNTDLTIILSEYEVRAKKRIIRDSAIQGATLTIESNGPFETLAQSLDFIEKSLLLNGFALVPTNDPNTLKLIAYSGGKQPRSEGVPVIAKPEDLPDSDEIVTFIMPLTHLAVEDAAETFNQIIPPHPYGNITALSNAQALVITENASVIKGLIELRDQIDLPPSEMVDRAFQLQRGDAEDIAEALAEILGIESEDTGSSSSRPAAANPAANNPPATRNGGAALPGNQAAGGAPASSGTTYGGGGKPTGVAGKPVIRAITRTNRVLVVARPADMAYIERLIEHLDSPQDVTETFSRKLNHLKPTSFLDIASDALTRGLDNGESGSGSSARSGSSRSNQSNTGFGNTGFDSGNSRLGGGMGGDSSGFGSSGLGGSGFGGGNSRRSSGGGGGSGGFGNSNLQLVPISMVVGKTLLIADDVNSSLLISGPQEQIDLIDKMLETLDVKPRQIQISAIIAQLNLGEDFEFGFDLIRTLETVGPDGRRYNGAGLLKTRNGTLTNILESNVLDEVADFPLAQGLSIYGQVNPYLDVFLSTLASTNRFEVLSRPTIYTLNNEYASILNGQRVAVPRSTQSLVDPDGGQANQVVTASIDYVDVVLQIDVLPSINANDEITLKIRQVNDSIVGSQSIGNDDIPTIGTQELETTVMVPNGGTVLLGGLISENNDKDESTLPWIKDVPLVGDVFGSRTRAKDRNELLIFIQPKIIDNETDRDAVDQDLKTRTTIAEDAEEFIGDLPVAESAPAAKDGFFKRVIERFRWGNDKGN